MKRSMRSRLKNPNDMKSGAIVATLRRLGGGSIDDEGSYCVLFNKFRFSFSLFLSVSLEADSCHD